MPFIPLDGADRVNNLICCWILSRRFDDLRWFNDSEFGLPVNYSLDSSRLKSFNKTTFYILNLHLFILEWKYVATLFTKMIIIYLYFLCIFLFSFLFFSGKYYSDGLFIPYETNFYSISIKKKTNKICCILKRWISFVLYS